MSGKKRAAVRCTAALLRIAARYAAVMAFLPQISDFKRKNGRRNATPTRVCVIRKIIKFSCTM